MRNSSLALRTFIAIQVAVLLAATLTIDRWGVFRGIVAAQAGLLGVWLGAGEMRREARIFAAAAVGVPFAIAIATLTFDLPLGGLLGRNGFGWQFLLLTVRVVIVGCVYWRAFGRHGYTLTTSGEPPNGTLLRFSLLHLFVLMTVVALFFAISRDLEGGSSYEVLLVAYVMLLGVAYAGISLLTPLMVLEPTQRPGRFIAYAVAILAISLAITAHNYQQTDRWQSAMYTWLEIMVEVAWLTGSLAALRLIGMRLAKVPVPDSPLRMPWLRFSLKAMFVLFTLAAVWLGWNVSTVQERKHLRALIDGRPTSSGTMAVITAAEGDAAASKAVKDRIAPHVIEAFQIRNRGGQAIGPRSGGDFSLIRRWLGDEHVFIILLDADSDLQDDVEAAFPEAMIVVRPGQQPQK